MEGDRKVWRDEVSRIEASPFAKDLVRGFDWCLRWSNSGGLRSILKEAMSSSESRLSQTLRSFVTRQPQLPFHLLAVMLTSATRPSHPSIFERPQFLEPTTTELLGKLPKFRILVIGKAGTGKSTLINRTFNVSLATTSECYVGKSNIEDEITSPSNERFILHDSKGFEPGETKNLQRVKTFIKARQRMPHLKDRLHAIWFCIAVPPPGGRSFETGDEDFLRRDLGDVPVIVVFTKYDVLLSSVERELDVDNEDLVIPKAKEEFKRLCSGPLRELTRGENHSHPYVWVSRHHGETLKALVQTTQEAITGGNPILKAEIPSRSSIEAMLPGATGEILPVQGHNLLERTNDNTKCISLTWAMAQQVSPHLKIQASIEIGRNKYWRGLASSLHFLGYTLEKCLATIHIDIINVWNFNDPNSYLTSKGILKDRILKGIEHMVYSIPAGVDEVPLLFKWVHEVYEESLYAVQSLMGYIIDLTIIMQNLFWIMLKKAEAGPVTTQLLEEALNGYYDVPAGPCTTIHQKIMAYVEHISPLLGPNHVFNEVTSLIATYSGCDQVLSLILEGHTGAEGSQLLLEGVDSQVAQSSSKIGTGPQSLHTLDKPAAREGPSVSQGATVNKSPKGHNAKRQIKKVVNRFTLLSLFGQNPTDLSSA